MEVLNLTNELPNNLSLSIPKFLIEQQRVLNNLKHNLPSIAAVMIEQAQVFERIRVDITDIVARALMEQ